MKVPCLVSEQGWNQGVLGGVRIPHETPQKTDPGSAPEALHVSCGALHSVSRKSTCRETCGRAREAALIPTLQILQGRAHPQ